mmetsp:Transcript_5242/g.5649  ORF Transcript_5242/g.5649 Transcript_5242/m.5649 type:complete len:388 (+) Transcript_5242:73-1236(+)|eukprot:CAMPEP_0176420722 /NCGR_PEP_ID=MMETSP0127-20121128/8765_1 /TAXON_ID=938130 /ORGANISM="Platyophrya macrostoma, Strain WH" /LENGTH=387 /DNA_ID=CAMNT_0017801351 /DNA_START=60 /DNA_END=1223 /DNA_ORIENTATION=+
MGNGTFKGKSQEKTSTLSVNNFQYQHVLGSGGFGKVWKVMQKKTKRTFAMKELSKARIITKKSVDAVMNERQLLSQLKHPFLVNMIYAFQDRENLYLVMDLLSGGDLRYHIAKHKTFSEQATKFFVACILTSLEFIHSNGILHRGVEPENLVFDEKGYLRLTDFGIARVLRPENSTETSGTPGYMAPEVMCRQNHGVAVDYYALGVIAYECMFGRRPYVGTNRKEVRDQILARQVQIKRNEIPHGWSLEAADFINRSIQRKPNNRLGIDGPSQVKNHPWLRDFPWSKLNQKEIQSDFVPSVNDTMDLKQSISSDVKDENEETVNQNTIMLRRDSVQALFEGYNYDSITTTVGSLNPIKQALAANGVSVGSRTLDAGLNLDKFDYDQD